MAVRDLLNLHGSPWRQSSLKSWAFARARSAFKLLQLDEEFNFIAVRNSFLVIDSCTNTQRGSYFITIPRPAENEECTGLVRCTWVVVTGASTCPCHCRLELRSHQQTIWTGALSTTRDSRKSR